jgi:hypothetical protein
MGSSTSINLRVRVTSSHGLLLWAGGPGNDFIMLGVRQGVIEVARTVMALFFSPLPDPASSSLPPKSLPFLADFSHFFCKSFRRVKSPAQNNTMVGLGLLPRIMNQYLPRPAGTLSPQDMVSRREQKLISETCNPGATDPSFPSCSGDTFPKFIA